MFQMKKNVYVKPKTSEHNEETASDELDSDKDSNTAEPKMIPALRKLKPNRSDDVLSSVIVCYGVYG